MYLKTKGLVLRETAYRDADLLLTVLTENHGKMTLAARGVRKKNSPIKAACQLLTCAEFTIFEYRGKNTINEASVIELFPELRKDLELLSLGSYFAQVAEVLSQEDAPSPDLLSLTLNALFALSRLHKPQLLVKSVFELRAACFAGFEPQLGSCPYCGNQTPDRFNLNDGTVECASCPGGDGIRLPVTPGVLDAMRYIVACENRKLYGFSISDESMKMLSGITESYLSTQLEKSFSALDFYKSLFLNMLTDI